MSKVGGLFSLLGFGLIGVSSCVYTVLPGERALILDNITGLKQNVYEPGYRLKIPFIQNVIKYDVRLKPIDISVATGTKDLQNVSISLRILHEPIVEALPTIHKLLGKNYDRKVFDSIGQEILRTVVAQYDADQLLKNRENISREIKVGLCEKAREFNINVEDVSFMHLGFSREYAMAVERRAVQQQLAEKQKFIVLRDQELKNAQIIRSEAEAEAAKLINESVRKFGSTQIQIKKLEASLSIAQLLAKNPNISFIPTNSTGNLLNLRV